MSLRATASSGPKLLAGLNADGSQVSWFEANWPFFSWAIFLIGAGMLAARYRARDQAWYGWLSVVMYCLHQSEEHAYDVRGWRYAFVPSLNVGPIAAMYANACAGGDPFGCPLDPKITLYVNVVGIWVGFGGCVVATTLYPQRFLLAAALGWGTAVVNGLFGHILPAILTSSYNPGVVQSIVMVPLGVYIIRKSGKPWLCLLNGFLGHVFLIAAATVIFSYHTDEAWTTILFILFGFVVVPLAVSNYVMGRDKLHAS